MNGFQRLAPQKQKSRRGGTPESIRPRRLTLQRVPRPGRVALHLVIRPAFIVPPGMENATAIGHPPLAAMCCRRNPGRDRSRHQRGNESLRAGLQGPRPQGHPRRTSLTQTEAAFLSCVAALDGQRSSCRRQNHYAAAGEFHAGRQVFHGLGYLRSAFAGGLQIHSVYRLLPSPAS